jgi:hypothetical protein
MPTVVSNDDGLSGRDQGSGERGSNFTRGVTDSHLGADTPGEKLLDNGKLDSSAKRLRELSLVDTRGGSGLEKSVLKSPLRSVRKETEGLIKLADGSQEVGVVLHELRTHVSPSSTVTGKSETDFVDLFLLSNSKRSSIVSNSRGDSSRSSTT